MADTTIQDALATAARHHQAGELPQAEAIYRQILAFKPDDPDALHLLGVLAAQTGHADAILLLRRAIAHRPQFPEAYSHLAYALHMRGELNEAITCYRTSLAQSPDSPETWMNLGDALTMAGDPLEAARCCRHAIALQPGVPQAHNNLGDALRAAGSYDEAIAEFRTAIRIDPTFAEAHGKLAHALLRRGELEEGYREYEWRWKCHSFDAPRRQFAQPRWDGSDLAGRTILLYAEQGLGDTIQQARFAPIIATRGGRVVIACAQELVRLLRQSTCLGATQVVSNLADIQEPIDTQLPMMSLPYVMGIRAETDIPRNVPYLSATPRELDGEVMKVGLVWSGSSAHALDRGRSTTLSALSALASERIAFYSLQVGPAAAEALTPPAGMHLVDCSPQIRDFADTAGIVASLDLVICVDTAAAHLAGAMGKKVWVMLPPTSDFRWMMDREDSPWYPTMRLFRQHRPGDWGGVIRRVRDQLQKLTVMA
jgi:tetratricopeptide (TPR) repeat protein